LNEILNTVLQKDLHYAGYQSVCSLDGRSPNCSSYFVYAFVKKNYVAPTIGRAGCTILNRKEAADGNEYPSGPKPPHRSRSFVQRVLPSRSSHLSVLHAR